MRPAVLAAPAALLCLVALAAHAAPPTRAQMRAQATAQAAAGDLLPAAERQRQAMHASQLVPPSGPAARVTEADVGDADSFGRSLTWLGVTQGQVSIDVDCSAYATEDHCVQMQPGLATTGFVLQDIATITLPAKASTSLLCHWFSPLLSVYYQNPGASAAHATLRYSPTLTIENAVLSDPAMIDPTTGAPFNGRLTASMTSAEVAEVPLQAGEVLYQRQRDTATCIAGFVSRKALIETWGLTPVQADRFFRTRMVIHLNVSGSAQNVAYAQMIYGLRVIGD